MIPKCHNQIRLVIAFTRNLFLTKYEQNSYLLSSNNCSRNKEKKIGGPTVIINSTNPTDYILELIF